MQEIISCPSCKRKLQVPEGLIGQDVQCPTCGATFTARVGGPAYSSAPPRYADESPDRYDDDRRRDRNRDSRRRYDEDREMRRDLLPHRGSAILTLGIISIVTAVALWCPIISVILGPIAWTMGNTDLADIQAGRMDPDGESSTNAGRICGMVGTGLGALGIIGCGLYLAFITALVGTR